MGTWDQQLFLFCYGGTDTGWLFRFMIGATILGSGWSMLAIFPFLLRPATRRWAMSLTATLLATAVVVFGLKLAFARVRPPVALGIHPLFGTPSDFSFPSGHAAGAFATAAFIGLVGLRRAQREPSNARWLRGAAATLAIAAFAVGYSRIYLGAHFPIDVLAGATLGSLLGALGAGHYERWKSTDRGAGVVSRRP